ncbi:HNH endonuclease [Candidatus Woesearchaeota archaeon]|nr:MAG: HNH endonuclease [Candidatus Woesearchaeota archaeon]
MAQNPFGIKPVNFGLGPAKKKRETLTPARRIYIWERPKTYGRTCSICRSKIAKLSDLELDHTKAYSKGGKTLALAHKECNRLKGSGGLRKIQKTLGIKTKTRKRVTKKKRKPSNPFGIKPIKIRPIKIPRFKL